MKAWRYLLNRAPLPRGGFEHRHDTPSQTSRDEARQLRTYVWHRASPYWDDALEYLSACGWVEETCSRKRRELRSSSPELSKEPCQSSPFMEPATSWYGSYCIRRPGDTVMRSTFAAAFRHAIISMRHGTRQEIRILDADHHHPLRGS